MLIPGPKVFNSSSLKNRELASSTTWSNLLDETLHITSGTALDMSSWRQTAVPAGSKGRISTSGTKLFENGVEVRFNVATWPPDPTFQPIPNNKSIIKNAAEHLAKCGYNAIRIHGVENWLMSGVKGAATFDPLKLDLFDYFLSELKAAGIFWVINIMSYNLFLDMNGAINRFNYTSDTSAKARIYTEQNIRDNWFEGINALLNRQNKYTNTTILHDPALLFLAVYNEQSTTFCASVSFPSVWKDRTTGASPAAFTWGEWLSDSSKSGYLNISALNSAWGTSYVSFTEAANSPVDALNTSFNNSRKNVDVLKYCEYLEDDLSLWYKTKLTSLGFQGLSFWSEIYTTLFEGRGYGKHIINDVYAPHMYPTVINDSINTGSTQLQGNNTPVTEYENAILMTPLLNNNKPFIASEFGWPAWCKYMTQFPVIAAAARSHDCQYITHFSQGDFFTSSYYNDTSVHGNRIRRIEPYHNPGNLNQDFIRVLLNSIVLRGDVTPLNPTYRQTLLLNDRHWGVNPINSNRPFRAVYSLIQPLYFISALRRAGVDWTDDTTDDSLATTWIPKQLSVLCSEAITDGAISGSHPTAVSVSTNSGSIASIAFTGVVGGLTASTTSPVLQLTGNTLATGDVIFISNITGSSGTWPGVSLRNTPLSVTKGTGDYVQINANFSSASGTMTSGTWCEGANVIVSGNLEWGFSRRLKQTFINTSKTVFYSHWGASLPISFGNVEINSLTTDASLFVTSLDGLPISTSSHLLIGMAADAQNTGMTFTDSSRKTILTGGDYPIQTQDCTATLTIQSNKPQSWNVYRLQRNGLRVCKESPINIDVDSEKISLSLRTGEIFPSCFWELKK